MLAVADDEAAHTPPEAMLTTTVMIARIFKTLCRITKIRPEFTLSGPFITSRLVSIQKRGILLEIKACEKFYHRHSVDIPRIKF